MPLYAGEFHEGFEERQPTWQPVIVNAADLRIRSQRRHVQERQAGESSELFEVEAVRNGAFLQLEHSIPPSVPLDELSLSLACRATTPGTVAALRLVFPHATHPRDGSTLTAWLTGDQYRLAGQWQTLSVSGSPRAVRERIVRLRAEFQSVSLDLSDAYFDRAMILQNLPRGVTTILVDELHWTGFVAPQRSEVVQVAATAAPAVPVEMRLDRLMVDHRPVILRFAPHHGESVDLLKELGLNLVWVDDYRDEARLQALREAGLWAMATPPLGRVSEADDRGDVRLSLDRFGPETSGILAWLIGTRVPSDAYDRLASQTRLVRAADQERNRPVFADIGGLERRYSRLLDGVGLSRHPLHTAFSLHDYRRFLTWKTRLLRPGTFVTTWIQTEVEPEGSQLPSPLPVIEPDLIRLQAWTAVAAGAKGIGFWKRTSFEDTFPGANERQLIVAITNQEIELLEPWLSTRSVIEYQTIPVRSADDSGQPGDSDTADAGLTGETMLRARTGQTSEVGRGDTPPATDDGADNFVEMAAIHSPNGLLLLPVWYQRDAQFVPGRMAGRDLEITIPGIEDTATIWEVSTTRVRSVPRQASGAGVRIKLENFDQVAALVVSTDPNWGSILRSQIEQIQLRSAGLWLQLARERLKRVEAIDQQLRELGVGVPDADIRLAQARRFLVAGDARYGRLVASVSTNPGILAVGFSTVGSDPDAVRTLAQASLQSLRILQRTHWERAVATLSSPLSSPYTVSFETLPDHWKLVRRIGASVIPTDSNLLPSGTFDTTDTRALVETVGWKHRQADVDGVTAAAEVVSVGRDGGLALRMVTLPASRDEIPVALDGIPLTIQSPPVSVRRGQIIHIAGRVRVPVRQQATLEGVTLTESLTGTRMRWMKTSGWESFELIREVSSDADLSLKLTMHGLGEAWFDDLRIVAAEPPPARLDIEPSESPVIDAAPEARRGPLDFLKRLPKLR